VTAPASSGAGAPELPGGRARTEADRPCPGRTGRATVRRFLGQGTADVLRGAGTGERMDREDLGHDGSAAGTAGAAARTCPPSPAAGPWRSTPGPRSARTSSSSGRTKAAPLLFEAEVLAAEGTGTDHPRVRFRQWGAEDVLERDCGVGCDGFRGVSAGSARVFERTYPFGRLGILADVPPSPTGGTPAPSPSRTPARRPARAAYGRPSGSRTT
jgi:hypothetical protein